jgi:hypothetical protein
MNDRDDRIREMAYFLWVEEGRPDGEADRHWRVAENRIDSEPLERKRAEGEPPGEPADDSLTPVPGVPGARSKQRAGPAEKNL